MFVGVLKLVQPYKLLQITSHDWKQILGAKGKEPKTFDLESKLLGLKFSWMTMTQSVADPLTIDFEV